MGTAFLNPSWDLREDWLMFYDLIPVEIPSLNKFRLQHAPQFVKDDVTFDENAEPEELSSTKETKEAPRPRVYQWLEHIELVADYEIE